MRKTKQTAVRQAAAVLFLLMILTGAAGQAQEDYIWIELDSEYSVEERGRDQARRLALQRLQREAIARACGEEIASLTHTNMSILMTDVCQSLFKGFVKDTDVLEDTYLQNSEYSLRARFNVICDQGNRDPGFHLGLDLNKHTFEEGEKLNLRVTSTRDCYITALFLYESGDIRMLFPHEHDRGNFCAAGDTMTIPGNENYSINLETSRGFGSDHEAVLIVATREDVSILGDETITIDGRKSYGRKIPLQVFVNWITAIDRDKREISIDGYKIFARKNN